MNRGINHMQNSMNATKLKQEISNLQSQIAQQQAAYVNKQPGGGHSVRFYSNISYLWHLSYIDLFICLEYGRQW